MKYNRRVPLAASATPPPKQKSRPYKSGYEAYKNPGYIPDLQVDPSLWATPPEQQSQPGVIPGGLKPQASSAQPKKKMMSLEEVEATLPTQPKKPSPPPTIPQQNPQAQIILKPVPQAQFEQSFVAPMHIPQHPEHATKHSINRPKNATSVHNKTASQPEHLAHASQAEAPMRVNVPSQASHTPQILQRGQHPSAQPPDVPNLQQPRQILQNPKRHSGQHDGRSLDTILPLEQSPTVTLPTRSTAPALPVITHPSQLANLTEEQRQAFMAEDAKRAKRNHKIYLLSKGNGLMTPQDKNFITRIQLQQLMTATGNVNEQDPDVSLAEDFYYQVYNQIENRPQQHSNQPLNNFAQTYLFQTGGRSFHNTRRPNRGDNHMHRMQQQVQRAVEAAKAKPKNKQLVIEGSLGRISFSNAKTPKPLLNIKGNEKLVQANLNTTDRKAVLKSIEAVYNSLMKIEDHDRRIPQQPINDQDPASAEPYIKWRRRFKQLNQKLWSDLKVREPIIPESIMMHPFIAFLSYPKGKKAIPRIFTHLDQEQRLTVLTIIMIQLDTIDVVRSAQPQVAASSSPSVAREQVDLFLQYVMPSLFSYVTEAPLDIVTGLIGLVVDRINVPSVVRSQVGLEILTMLLSQAEIIRKGESPSAQEWEQWLSIYSHLFDTIEPLLAEIFPRTVTAGQDVYVWQFLASMGTGASPEQQQRLVLAVKYVATSGLTSFCVLM